MRAALAALLLLSALSCADSFTVRNESLLHPPFSEVDSHNWQVNDSLLGYHTNYGNLPENTPTLDDPFIWKEIRVFTALPSVNSTIESNHSPLILWGWGEYHNQSFEEYFDLCPDAAENRARGSGCCGVHWQRTTISNATLKDITANITVIQISKPVNLSIDGPNPFNSSFNFSELEQRPVKINRTITPTAMLVNISGTWEVERVTHKWCPEMVCEGENCTPQCKDDCENNTDSSPLTYPDTGVKSFTLHNGVLVPVTTFPLGDIDVNITLLQYVISSRRDWVKYIPTINGKALDGMTFYEYSIAGDPYDVNYILLQEVNRTGVNQADSDFDPFLPKNSTNHRMSLLRLGLTLNGSNTSGITEYYNNNLRATLNFPRAVKYNESLGFTVYDYFDQPFSGRILLAHRKYTGLNLELEHLSSGPNSAQMRLMDEDSKPVSGAVIELYANNATAILITDSAGKASYNFEAAEYGSYTFIAFYPGDAERRPVRTERTFVIPPIASAGANADFSTVPWPLLVLLGIFAGLAFVTTGYIFGMNFIMSIINAVNMMGIIKVTGMGKIMNAPASLGRALAPKFGLTQEQAKKLAMQIALTVATGGAGAAAAGAAAKAGTAAAAKAGTAAAGKAGAAAGKAAASGKGKVLAEAARKQKLGMAQRFARKGKQLLKGGMSALKKGIKPEVMAKQIRNKLWKVYKREFNLPASARCPDIKVLSDAQMNAAALKDNPKLTLQEQLEHRAYYEKGTIYVRASAFKTESIWGDISHEMAHHVGRVSGAPTMMDECLAEHYSLKMSELAGHPLGAKDVLNPESALAGARFEEMLGKDVVREGFARGNFKNVWAEFENRYGSQALAKFQHHMGVAETQQCPLYINEPLKSIQANSGISKASMREWEAGLTHIPKSVR